MVAPAMSVRNPPVTAGALPQVRAFATPIPENLSVG
jgi:hypothetical protein